MSTQKVPPIYPNSQTIARFSEPFGANRITSACGTMIHRDELLGAEFSGNAFICEPVHNLVHRDVLQPSGVTFTSQRAEGTALGVFRVVRKLVTLHQRTHQSRRRVAPRRPVPHADTMLAQMNADGSANKTLIEIAIAAHNTHNTKVLATVLSSIAALRQPAGS